MKSTEPDFLTKTERSCRAFGIGRGTSVLAAVSGGPDSTALALVLGDLSGRLGFRLALGYFNHALRSPEEAEEELAIVRGLSERLRVGIEIGEAPVGELRRLARAEGRSLEDVARGSRYGFLAEAMERQGCSRLALGHTSNDQAETRIIRVFQGSSPSGLKGIPLERGSIIRPILSSSRTEVLSYLASKGQAYCTDRSNLDVGFLRNKVRRDLVPALREVFPGYDRALENMARKSRLYESFVREAVAREIPFKADREGYVASRTDFFGLHPVLRLAAVYRLFDETSEAKNRRLPFSFLKPLLRKEGPRGDGIVLRGRGIELRAEGDSLFWRSRIVLDRKKSYLYVIDESMCIDIQGKVRIQVEEAGPGNPSEGDSFRCDEHDVLILRSRRQGDVMRTSGGKKTLKKLFSDLKIPERERDLVPVVQDSREILGILAGRFGSKTIRSPESKIGEHGRIFRFRVFRIGEERGQTRQFE